MRHSRYARCRPGETRVREVVGLLLRGFSDAVFSTFSTQSAQSRHDGWAPTDVGCRANSGHGMGRVRTSGFDPGCVKTQKSKRDEE
jgi:hypothetical protein